jgi:uncharacterized protein YeaO (DUF488 family)
LVDRLWPRGVTKERLKLDARMKDIAPSPELRQWFGHDEGRWGEFQERYRKELQAHSALIEELRSRSRTGRLTLIFAARDQVHNSAALLKYCLEGK